MHIGTSPIRPGGRLFWRATAVLTEAGRLAGHVAFVVVRVDIDVGQKLEQDGLGRVDHTGGHGGRDAGGVRHAADPLHLAGIQPLHRQNMAAVIFGLVRIRQFRFAKTIAQPSDGGDRRN